VTIVYFDSSAFVKLLVEEDGSDLAATLWDGCDAAVSSRLAYPEVRAACAGNPSLKRTAEVDETLTDDVTNRAGRRDADRSGPGRQGLDRLGSGSAYATMKRRRQRLTVLMSG
jgi:hypothetical protein